MRCHCDVQVLLRGSRLTRYNTATGYLGLRFHLPASFPQAEYSRGQSTLVRNCPGLRTLVLHALIILACMLQGLT